MVTITEEHDVGMDEAWCKWFRCPGCEDEYIYNAAV